MKVSLLKSASIFILALLPTFVVAQTLEGNTTESAQQNIKTENNTVSSTVDTGISTKDKLRSFVDNINISGFFTGRAMYTDEPGKYSGFDIRFLRVKDTGDLGKDFSYCFQFEFTGTPRIVDTYLTWHRYSFFKIRAGQMKRNFTYENRLAPLTIGVSDFSQSIMKLAGLADRSGEHNSNGRDVGILLMGDLIKLGEKHNLIHYDLGVFNGNGINKADNNKYKDVVGSLHISPIRNLEIGGAYWDGQYGPEGQTVRRDRWTCGFRFENPKYMLSAEYISSKGGVYDKPDEPLKSDGWFVTGGMPIAKNVKLYAKYDTYRDDKTDATKIDRYFGALNFKVHKNVVLQFTYCYTDGIDKQDYNNVVGQMFVNF